MKNNITELVFILDRSGSMAGLEADTIGGFNAMIEKQRAQDGECYVTTVLFDHEYQTLHDRIRLADIPKMTGQDYSVRGSTALVDAIGKTIDHISLIHKYARPEDVPEHTVFVIITDGMDNASHIFSADQIKRMIMGKKETCAWEFLFIGANIDAIHTARSFGIPVSRAVNYTPDARGTRVMYDTVAKATCNIRAAMPLSADWSNDINEDYQSRGKNKK